MSAAAEARLRAIVARVATAAGIDPRDVPVRIDVGQGEWRVARAGWPATGPSLAECVGAYGADAAVDAAARSYAEWAAHNAAAWSRKAAEAERERARWSAIGAAVAVRR